MREIKSVIDDDLKKVLKIDDEMKRGRIDDALLRSLIQMGIEAGRAQELLAKPPGERVQRCLEVARQKAQRNPAGYLWTLLEHPSAPDLPTKKGDTDPEPKARETQVAKAQTGSDDRETTEAGWMPSPVFSRAFWVKERGVYPLPSWGGVDKRRPGKIY